MSRPLALAALVSLAGCALVPRKYARVPPAPDRYYVASFDIERASQAAALADRAEALARDAATVLRVGQRVAFFPPDTCLDTAATPRSGGDREYIEMRCGVLMSSLETHMARAGYEVVSWQALKPSMAGLGNSQAGGTALERARGLEVDVLFEVDQLTAGEREVGQTRATGIDFYSQSSSTSRSPLTVSRDTALQCKGISDRIVGLSSSDEHSATLSSKAVDVQTGRAVWYYQKTKANETDRSADVARDYYFVARGETPHPGTPSPEYNGKQRAGDVLVNQVGSWLFALGAAAGAGGAALAAGTGDASLAGVGGAVAGTGILFWIGGGALVKQGNEEASRPVPLPADLQPIYPGPEAVICKTKPVRPAWMAPADDDDAVRVQTPTPPSNDSSFSFEDRTVAQSDAGKRLDQQLFDDVVQDFVGELTALSATAPPPSAVATP